MFPPNAKKITDNSEAMFHAARHLIRGGDGNVQKYVAVAVAVVMVTVVTVTVTLLSLTRPDTVQVA